MIYLAAPFWHEDALIRTRRVETLCAFHKMLLLTRPSGRPTQYFYNPLANSQGAEVGESEEYWREHGLHVLSRCEELYVLCLPGWKESKGVRMEIELALARTMPISYFTNFHAPQLSEACV